MAGHQQLQGVAWDLQHTPAPAAVSKLEVKAITTLWMSNPKLPSPLELTGKWLCKQTSIQLLLVQQLTWKMPLNPSSEGYLWLRSIHHGHFLYIWNLLRKGKYRETRECNRQFQINPCNQYLLRELSIGFQHTFRAVCRGDIRFYTHPWH